MDNREIDLNKNLPIKFNVTLAKLITLIVCTVTICYQISRCTAIMVSLYFNIKEEISNNRKDIIEIKKVIENIKSK
jgi:hypothetical protein